MADRYDKLKLKLKLKMSLEEEEEWKSNVLLRDELIARRVEERESSNECLKAAGEEPISYNPKITEYNWLLHPPSVLKRISTYMPDDNDDSQWKLLVKRKRYPTEASTSSKEANKVETW